MIKECLLLLLLVSLWGCASSRDFQATPQEGAQRSAGWPRFSDKPEAQTAQFTQTDSQTLTRELEDQAQSLQKQANSSAKNARNSKLAVQNLVQEVEQTLHQIEQVEPQTQTQTQTQIQQQP